MSTQSSLLGGHSVTSFYPSDEVLIGCIQSHFFLIHDISLVTQKKCSKHWNYNYLKFTGFVSVTVVKFIAIKTCVLWGRNDINSK